MMDEGNPKPATIDGPVVDDDLAPGAVDLFEDDASVDGYVIDGEDLASATVDGIGIRNCRLERVVFTGAELSGLDLVDVEFVGCEFSGCVLENASFQRVTFRGCRMSGLAVPGLAAINVTFSECQMADAWFRMTKLDRVAFVDCDLTAADFYQSSIAQSRIVGCDLTSGEFSGAKLDDVAVHGTTFDGIKGADSLRNLTIAHNQLHDLARPILSARGIRIDDDYLDP